MTLNSSFFPVYSNSQRIKVNIVFTFVFFFFSNIHTHNYTLYAESSVENLSAKKNVQFSAERTACFNAWVLDGTRFL